MAQVDRTILLDATVLFNFALADALDRLIYRLGAPLAVGRQMVERELKVWPRRSDHPGRELSLEAYFANGALRRVEVQPEERWAFVRCQRDLNLGLGEAEGVAIAHCRLWTFATDDGRARSKIAVAFPRLPLSGTIGLIDDLVEGGAIDPIAGDELLERIWDRGGTPRGKVSPRLV